jgi:hypothetical protein
MLNALLGPSNSHQSTHIVVEITKNSTETSLYTLVIIFETDPLVIIFETDPCSFGVCLHRVWIIEEML